MQDIPLIDKKEDDEVRPQPVASSRSSTTLEGGEYRSKNLEKKEEDIP